MDVERQRDGECRSKRRAAIIHNAKRLFLGGNDGCQCADNHNE